MTVKTWGLGFIRAIMTVKTQGSASGCCQNPVVFHVFLLPRRGLMKSSSWQQEHMQKHRLLATARGRTLCFYSHNGSEKTRTLCFCICFCCQEEDSILVLSWQQETLKKNRVLATTLCRTLCFYSHNGLEITRTLCFHSDFGVDETRTLYFCIHSRTMTPSKCDRVASGFPQTLKRLGKRDLDPFKV